jgi:virulence-associated protein VagC
MTTAKVFHSGGSQAVRLPRVFRFRDHEVSIRREGEAVILEPIRGRTWSPGFWRRIRIGDAAFARPSQGAVPTRRSLEGDA